MKKLFLIFAMLMSMAASAADFVVNGVAYKVLSLQELTVEVTKGCMPDNGKLVIPATVDYKDRTFTVLGIGEGEVGGGICNSKCKELVIKNGPTYISNSAFCSQDIEIVKIPSSITLIKNWAFRSNHGHFNSLLNWIRDPIELVIEDGDDLLEGEYITFMGSSFSDCKITKLYLGRAIDDGLISDAAGSLEELIIGDKVTTFSLDWIWEYGLTDIKTLTIGKAVEEVPYLNEGDNLKEIYVRSETPPASNGFRDGTLISATLYVPRGTKDAYGKANVWKDFWTVEEYDVKDNNPNQCDYAEFDTSTGTLTFKYGVKPNGDNIYETANTNFDSDKPAPWVSKELKTVVFDESYSVVRPKSTAYWFDGATFLTSISGLEYLNTSEVTKMSSMFLGCVSLNRIDVSHFNTEKVQTMNSMFSVCEKLYELNLSNFNTCEVYDMSYMFSGCSGLLRLNLGDFNTEKVESMILLFNGCEKLSQLDLTSFNTANVTRMDNMFSRCSNLRNIYVCDKWTTTKVSNSNGMFLDCQNLVGSAGTTYDSNHTNCTYARPDGGSTSPGYLTLTSKGQAPSPYAILDSSTATLTFKYGPMPQGDNIYWMDDVNYLNYYKSKNGNGFISPWYFHQTEINTVVFDKSYSKARPQCTRKWFVYLEDLTSIKGIENLNTSDVTNMEAMFSNCISLTKLDLSCFMTSKVVNMAEMFYKCTNLTTIYVSDRWSTAMVNNSAYMFEYCTKLIGEAGTAFNSEHIDANYAHIDGGANNPGYFSKILKGDANGDGALSPEDLKVMVDYIMGTTTVIRFSAADINNDGNVNATDIVMLLNILNNN